jgi:hypothetical protein
MNSLNFEKRYPYFGSLLAVGIWWWLGKPFPTDVKEFLAAALTFAAILTGFLATAQAILMALPAESVMGQIKSSGYIDELIRYMREAFIGMLLFAIINLIGFFFDTRHLPSMFAPFWVFFAALSLFAFSRVTSIVERLMKHR